MNSRFNHISGTNADPLSVMILSSSVLVTWAFEQFINQSSLRPSAFTPDWLPVAAFMSVIGGMIRMNGSPVWIRIQGGLRWSGLLLMIWVANGIIFDLLSLAGLIGDPATGQKIAVNWFVLLIRILALGTVVALARIVLALPGSPPSTRTASWYGYAAFVFALPYPVLRIWWALGGTTGLIKDDAAGQGIAPLLLCIPWLLAAALSLLLVSPKRRKHRRLLLVAGWSFTAVVASIAPSACWSLITKLASGELSGQNDMATWVFCLFYGSWLFWAIAAGFATRSFQLRSASS